MLPAVNAGLYELMKRLYEKMTISGPYGPAQGQEISRALIYRHDNTGNLYSSGQDFPRHETIAKK